VIRHTLFEEDEPESTVDDFIPTTDLIRNIEVQAELVDINYLAEFQQVTINDIEVHEFEIVSVEQEEGADYQESVTMEQEMSASEDQMLMFDLPINQHTPENILDIEVHEEELIIAESLAPEQEQEEEIGVSSPMTEFESQIRYVLEDETQAVKESEVVVNEMIEPQETMTLKTKEAPEEVPAEQPDNQDPTNTPIAQLLRERTEERKRKMKEFNYKFRNSASKIDEIERQPAYKRMGIELEDGQSNDDQLSRTTINLEDDEVDLRTNNSFLHDNVD
jgi:cell division protein FtsZ